MDRHEVAQLQGQRLDLEIGNPEYASAHDLGVNPPGEIELRAAGVPNKVGKRMGISLRPPSRILAALGQLQ